MTPKQREQFFSTLSQLNPNPTTELVYASTFELLIAVILSAQATDIAVNKATKRLFADANTARAMLKLGEKGLKKYIKTIGLYNTKAKHIIATCRILEEQFAGHVPQTRQELESLPGVGRKTANVVLNTAFDQNVIAVDTHIFRVANRTKLAAAKTPLAVETKLMKVIPPRFLKNAHHWLILHGRYICTARSPQCNRCPVRQYCGYQNKNILECKSKT